MTVFADLGLAKRLERAEGRAGTRFVEARAAIHPEVGACWIEVAGAFAMFDGPASPITQTFALGMLEPPTRGTLETIERFFRSRGADVFHEVSPLADASVVTLLNESGYRPLELSNALYRPLDSTSRIDIRPSEVRVRRIEPGEERKWAAVSAEGWSELKELGDFLRALGEVQARAEGVRQYAAELDGRMIAAAALNIVDGVALLAGASTVPEYRNRGAQLALLDRRLRDAADAGCDLAFMSALPGSGSQRNAERHGFRVAYTRTKWQLSGDASSASRREG